MLSNKKPEKGFQGITSPVKCSEAYALEWLDILVNFTLNPQNRYPDEISDQDEIRILDRLGEEALKIRSLVQKQMFCVQSKAEAELLIRNYHTTLTILSGQTFSNLENISPGKSNAHRIVTELLQLLEELISFIETRFSAYLSRNEYVSRTYFRLVQKECSLRLERLQSKISINSPQKDSFKIVTSKLKRFLGSNEFENSTSYKDISYKKKLIAELEKIDFNQKAAQGYTTVDRVLIYLNFNSREYINYLIEYIETRICKGETTEEKKSRLLFLYKSFNQMHKSPDTAYNKNFHSVETLINNWFSQELLYLEEHLSTITSSRKSGNDLQKNTLPLTKRHKVICLLSSDQIGLILRAADEQRILLAKSMSEVFKVIVPYLSTPAREHLSYDGMRSKSYSAEERDKRIAIETLEQIIKKIREY
ncbi:hypothetical protein [Agriterribacter sp.]|uniref:hypothetical protein n=1 Tax=Agriterribacter sp. TaxID=2821509 RepID=UPI002CFD7DAD|nr:hypothetical protein [Agriterribacter sp.]HRO46322.1 hypothetical protein [Agriterribacter sp.]HRQ17489.1 hypothetical protein [Agriterribacter sp.]